MPPTYNDPDCPLIVVESSSARTMTLFFPVPEIEIWFAASSPATYRMPSPTITCTFPAGTSRPSSASNRGVKLKGRGTRGRLELMVVPVRMLRRGVASVVWCNFAGAPL